jgi:hypothetical protein
MQTKKGKRKMNFKKAVSRQIEAEGQTSQQLSFSRSASEVEKITPHITPLYC